MSPCPPARAAIKAIVMARVKASEHKKTRKPCETFKAQVYHLGEYIGRGIDMLAQIQGSQRERELIWHGLKPSALRQGQVLFGQMDCMQRIVLNYIKLPGPLLGVGTESEDLTCQGGETDLDKDEDKATKAIETMITQWTQWETSSGIDDAIRAEKDAKSLKNLHFKLNEILGTIAEPKEDYTLYPLSQDGYSRWDGGKWLDRSNWQKGVTCKSGHAGNAGKSCGKGSVYDEKQDGKICKGLGECTQEDDFKDASSTCCRAVSTQVGEVDSNKDTVVSEGTCADGSRETWTDKVNENWAAHTRTCPANSDGEYKLMTVNNCESTPCKDADFFDYETKMPGPCCEAVISEDKLKSYAEGWRLYRARNYWESKETTAQSPKAATLIQGLLEKISALVKQAPGFKLTKTQWENLNFDPFKEYLDVDVDNPIFTTTKFDEIFKFHPKT